MRRKKTNLVTRAGEAHTGVLVVLSIAVIAFAALVTAPSALALPEGRVYEMVSPLYKGGYGATEIEAVAENGESVAYYSPGVFDGAPSGFSANAQGLTYLSRRSPTGWSTVPVMVPDDVQPWTEFGDISPSLETILALGKPGTSFEAAGQENIEEQFVVHSTGISDTSANWKQVGPALTGLKGETGFQVAYRGASRDFCHLLLREGVVGQPLLENADGGSSPQIYELATGCGNEPVALRLIGVNNEGEGSMISPACPVGIGLDDYSSRASKFNAISADGNETFFTTCVKNNQADHQLFMRLAESRTVEVSRSLSEACGEGEIPCAGASTRASADFQGASEDGLRVFFTTSARLSGEDHDSNNDLYMGMIGCPGVEAFVQEQSCEVSRRVVSGVVQVSRDPNSGEAAEVQGVLRVAPDGQRVYFVARGDLLSGTERAALEGEGRAVPYAGADNLYVYDGDGAASHVAFIGDLCSGRELSGSVEDVRCPSASGTDAELWTAPEGEAQTAGVDGRFLVFSTYAQLSSGDTDTAKDVYRYDAVSGELDRVSTGEAGYDANGNDNVFDATIRTAHQGGSVAEQYELNNRAISEDGSRIVFTTAGPLSVDAINGLENVYEWHKQMGWSEGRVSLVSSGAGKQPVSDVVISPNGNGIFFNTVQGLVPQDTDGAPDIYDARLETESFPSTPAQRRSCEGDACPGPLTNPAPLLVPGSVPQAPGGNFMPLVSKAVKTKKVKPKKKQKKSKKRRKTKGKASGHSGKASKASGRSRR